MTSCISRRTSARSRAALEISLSKNLNRGSLMFSAVRLSSVRFYQHRYAINATKCVTRECVSKGLCYALKTLLQMELWHYLTRSIHENEYLAREFNTLYPHTFINFILCWRAIIFVTYFLPLAYRWRECFNQMIQQCQTAISVLVKYLVISVNCAIINRKWITCKYSKGNRINPTLLYQWSR